MLCVAAVSSDENGDGGIASDAEDECGTETGDKDECERWARLMKRCRYECINWSLSASMCLLSGAGFT